MRNSKWTSSSIPVSSHNRSERTSFDDAENKDERNAEYDTKENYTDEEDSTENKSLDDESNEEDNDIDNAQTNEQIPFFVSFTAKDSSSIPPSTSSSSSSSSVPIIHILPQKEPIDASFLRSSIPPSILKAVVSRNDSVPTSYEGQRKLTTVSVPNRFTVGSKVMNTNKLINQPVTFRAQVKSSGYGSVAPRKPVWAKTAASQRSQNTSSSSSSASSKLLQITPSYRYDTSSTTNNVPNQMDDDIFGIHSKSSNSNRTLNSSSSSYSTATNNTTSSTSSLSSSYFPMGSVATVNYSYEGTHLAIGSYDGSLYSIRLGLSSGSFLNRNNTHHDNFITEDTNSVITDSTLSPPSKIQLRLNGPSTKHMLYGTATNTGNTSTATTNNISSNSGNKNGITSLSWSHGTYKGLSSRLVQASENQRSAKKGSTKSSIDTSTRHRLLVTNNNENGVSVWAGASGRTDPVFSIRSSSLTTVAATSFYYIDKFILCAAGDSIYAYSWLLNNDTLNTDENTGSTNDSLTKSSKTIEEDVTRLRNKGIPLGKSTLTTQWKANTNGSTVNNVTAHNTFRSPLVFTTSLDRSVRIYDCGQSSIPQEVLHIPEAHTRSIHSLIVPTNSTFAEVSGTAMNCFLTASTDSIGGVSNGGTGLLRLWDLRINKCVRQLTGSHSNRIHTCSATFSPDLMYIATGSEDRSIVIYDLRKDGDCVMKLRGATDTVTSVAWHPLLPHLIGGSLDGTVRFYRTTV